MGGAGEVPRGLLLGREFFDAVGALLAPGQRRQAELPKGAGGWDGLFSKVSVERGKLPCPCQSNPKVSSGGGGVAGTCQLTQGPAGWGCIHRSRCGIGGCGLCSASTEFGINRIHLLEGGDLIQTSRLHSL